MELKDVIKEKRKEKSLTQKQLAEKLGVSESTVRKYENGERTPSKSSLLILSTLLGIPIDSSLNNPSVGILAEWAKTINEEELKKELTEVQLIEKLFAFYGYKLPPDEESYNQLRAELKKWVEVANFKFS